ncbi:hypothetical protein BDB01DRAFT_846780 [Pilobolus umbonatus]|nr:hypothetical protein BDB01DRAFT_846780 [Pilobolus umbonatus]
MNELIYKADIDNETMRKDYENMSYDEMSKIIAESYKQISEICGNRISLPSATSSEDTADLLEDDDYVEEMTMLSIMEHTDLDEEMKKEKCTKLFLKAVSSGDLETITMYLNDDRIRQYIDIDGKDEDGTTPLIYATCFGKCDIAQALLVAGANVNSQDTHGWSALMWATTNNHESLVKLLMNYGASAQAKSAKGRTVFDFVKSDSVKSSESSKIAGILATNPRDSVSSTSSFMAYSSASSNAGDADRYYQYTTEENYENFLSHENEYRSKLIEEFLMTEDNKQLEIEDHSDDDSDYDQSNYEDDDSFDEDKEIEFDWDRCMPDQMFVFATDNLPYILDTVISNLSLPVRNVQEIFLPANVVFLSTRFAHYFSSSELANEVLEGSISRMNNAIKKNIHDVHVLSYWMTNITRLLYYLKKDAGLVISTAEYQLSLSELISETYTHMANDVGKRISSVVEPSMLEHDSILGMEDLNFADDWQRFFRRSNSVRRSSLLDDTANINRSSSNLTNTSVDVPMPNMKTLSPKTIIHMLDSTFFVLQSYEVHPTIIIQTLAQFFHFLSCELFNHILAKKKYLCRSKAIQIRMNLSIVEEWVHNNNLPNTLLSYMKPSIQLVQLLQCLSQLNTLNSFQSTISVFDSLNSLQIRRCVLNYRYEVNEPRLPEEIERSVNQSVEEIIRLKQARQSRSLERRKSQHSINQMHNNSRRTLSNRDSMSQMMGSFMGSVNMPVTTTRSTSIDEVRREIKPERRLSTLSQSKSFEDEEEDAEEDEKELKETKDSRFMLPFCVPTISQLSHASESKENIPIVPIITEEWMDKLDKNNSKQ